MYCLFSSFSIWLSVRKKRCVATAGPISGSPSVFQRIICRPEVCGPGMPSSAARAFSSSAIRAIQNSGTRNSVGIPKT